MKIKFNNLYSSNKKIEKNLINSFIMNLRKSSFIGGKEVLNFENNFRKINESKYCISCANGSDAIFVALKALEIKQGQEVITTCLSWIATSSAITMAGGKIKFCDIEKDSFNIDHTKIEKLITKNTVGIIPVHLYGHPSNMQEIKRIAKKYKLWIIEDCAQSHQSRIDNKLVGNFGDFGAFSFFPAKNLGALGDAGCLVTNNKILAKKAKLITTHGGKGAHMLEGINSRLDSIQASFLNIKIKHLKKNVLKRYKNALLYEKYLKQNKNIIFYKTPKKLFNSYHQFTILAKDRNNLKKYLSTKKIETNIYYSRILPDYPAYKHFKNECDLKNARKKIKRILSIPINENLKKKEIIFISNMINNFYKNK